MAFDLSKMNTIELNLDEQIRVHFSTWIRDWNNTRQRDVTAVMTIETGAMRMQTSLNKQQTCMLIEKLKLHLDNIGQAEIALHSVRGGGGSAQTGSALA